MVKILLHRGRGAISKLIQWQTRSPYSHASLLFDNGQVVEAREFKGVRWLKRPDWEKEEIDVFEVETTPEQNSAIWIFVNCQCGKPYDYTMVARFVSRRQETRKSSGKWFCSELVFAAFQKAGIELLARTEPWEVSPGLLAKSPLLKEVKPSTLNIQPLTLNAEAGGN